MKKPSQLTVSLPPDLLEFVKRRAEELGLQRAQLIAQYIRGDMLNEGKPFVVLPDPDKKPGASSGRS